MNDLKYIIVEQLRSSGIKRAIIFNGMINHCEVVPNEKYWKVISAGFCQVSGMMSMDVKVWGKSVSLGDLPSQPEDAEIIMRTVNCLHVMN